VNFNLTVRDVNDPPQITLTNSSPYNVSEKAPLQSTAFSFTVMDPDVAGTSYGTIQNVTWSLTGIMIGCLFFFWSLAGHMIGCLFSFFKIITGI
jgi:hypothetical protein